MTELSLGEVLQAALDPKLSSQAHHWLSSAVPTLHECLHRIVHQAEALLNGRGLPSKRGIVTIHGDSWRWVPEREASKSQLIIFSAYQYVFDHVEPDDACWYAASILQLIDELRSQAPDTQAQSAQTGLPGHDPERGVGQDPFDSTPNSHVPPQPAPLPEYSAYQILKALELGMLYKEAYLKKKFDDVVELGTVMKAGRKIGQQAGVQSTKQNAADRRELILQIARDISAKQERKLGSL